MGAICYQLINGVNYDQKLKFSMTELGLSCKNKYLKKKIVWNEHENYLINCNRLRHRLLPAQESLKTSFQSHSSDFHDNFQIEKQKAGKLRNSRLKREIFLCNFAIQDIN